ncbi:MAG: alpha/beta fold hydrolase [Alphaproteobacteria bacterium]
MTRMSPVTAKFMQPGETPAAFEKRVHDQAELRWTDFAGGRMAWHVWGLENGQAVKPPLVLFHGGYGSWRHWILNVVELSRRFTVFAADLPGLGDSDPAHDADTAPAIGAIASQGIDQLIPAPQRFDFAGFSFGGIIGGQVALLQGERMRTCTIIGSGALGLPFEELDGLMKVKAGQSVEELHAVHRNNLGIVMIATKENVDDLAVYVQDETTRRARARSGPIPLGDSLAKALPNIKARVCTIWGGRDGVVGRYLKDRLELFRRAVPGIQPHVIDGAGHWVIFEAADRVNPLLVELFLGSDGKA